MSAQFMTLLVVIAVVIVIGLAVVNIYNGFVRLRNLIQESWRQIDVELNRRYDLIPNLVETVRSYAAQERNTLENVTRLRNQAAALAQQGQGALTEERSLVEAQLTAAVRNLIVTVEAYPDLKSNVNFLELQRQLSETEDRIAAGRRYYNANVRTYNTQVESFPSNVVAGLFKFEKAAYFEVTDEQMRQAPRVDFGAIGQLGAPSGGPASSGLPNPQAQQPPTPPAGSMPPAPEGGIRPPQ